MYPIYMYMSLMITIFEITSEESHRRIKYIFTEQSSEILVRAKNLLHVGLKQIFTIETFSPKLYMQSVVYKFECEETEPTI